jgi:hypothetical protein
VTRLDDGRAELPSDVPSGGQVTTTIRLTSPSSPGDYLLELDLVQEAVAWFADRGSETLRVPVVVTEGGTHRVRWARDRRRAQTDETLPFYSIYAVPEEEVAAIVQTAGGEVVNVVDDESCGGGWVSRLYTATKVPAAD